MAQVKPFELMRVFNGQQGAARLRGIVFDNSSRAGDIYAMDAIESQALIKSIWATAVADKKRKHGLTFTGNSYYERKVAKPTKTLKVQLRGTQYQNWLLLYDAPELVLAMHPAGLRVPSYSAEHRELAGRHPEIMGDFARRLIRAINTFAPVPAHETWGLAFVAELAKYEYQGIAYKELTTAGVFVKAWLLKTEWQWAEFVAKMLRDGKVFIPPAPLVTAMPDMTAKFKVM